MHAPLFADMISLSEQEINHYHEEARDKMERKAAVKTDIVDFDFEKGVHKVTANRNAGYSCTQPGAMVI